MRRMQRICMIMISICVSLLSLSVRAEDPCAAGHEWTDWYVESYPTCTETGVERRECYWCEESETRSIPAEGHDWDVWNYEERPTCTDTGEKFRECMNCYTVQTASVPAYGHKWGSWFVDTKASIISKGSQHRICSRCKEQQNKLTGKETAAYGQAVTITMYAGQKESIGSIGLAGAKKYKSSSKSIAIVSKNGVISAKKAGKCTITVSNGSQRFTCNVKVYNPVINKKSMTMKIGATTTLKVKGGFGKNTWSSKNTSIAAVDTKGHVTAKKAGKTIIYAKNSGKTLKCTVTVRKSSSKKKNDADAGGSVWLSATGSKYHSYNQCGRMNPNKARKVSLSYAKSHGFGKCKNCW